MHLTFCLSLEQNVMVNAGWRDRLNIIKQDSDDIGYRNNFCYDKVYNNENSLLCTRDVALFKFFFTVRPKLSSKKN